LAGPVLLVEDDVDVLEMLALLLEMKCERHCVRARSFADLVAQERDALATEAAILDVNLGPSQPSGLDALQWLRVRSYRGRVCFLTGHAASHPLVRQAIALGQAAVLEKPVSCDQLNDAIEGRA
jgi:FixJ family two-component response regulator